jgi:hypothetical protein
MIHLGIFKTQRLVGNEYEDIYNLTLDQQDESNNIKNVTMPVPITSDIGIYLTSLINQVSLFNPHITIDALSQAKALKKISINNQWLTLEKTGWDSGQGFNLGITPSDVALIVGVYSLAKEAAMLGLELPKLISMSNDPISFTSIEQMTELLLRYGEARSILASSFAAKRKAVDDANSIEEVNSIE